MTKGAWDMHPVPLVSFSFSFDLTNYYLQLCTTATTANGETQHSRMRMQWQGLVCIFISFFFNCTYPWIDNTDSHYSTSTQVTQRLPMGLRRGNKIDARDEEERQGAGDELDTWGRRTPPRSLCPGPNGWRVVLIYSNAWCTQYLTTFCI